MSAEAAKAFGITQEDLAKFLDVEIPEIKKEQTTHRYGEISESAKHAILTLSIILFILAIVTCGCTVLFWLLTKRNRDQHKYEKLDQKDGEKADLAYQDAYEGPISTSKSLPQMTEKPKIQSNITFPEKEPIEDKELQKLRVEKLDISANYYKNRERIQINVRKIGLQAFDDKLKNNAYIYVVVALLPEKNAYYESELRPIAEENYFEEASEFEVTKDEMQHRTLKVSTFVCDRFSQHRLVDEYIHDLEIEEPEDQADLTILPVKMIRRNSSQPQETTPSKEIEAGDVLFSLCYMPTSGRLTFVALKGRNIHDDQGTPLATYLRVSLLVSGKTMKTVQTSSIRRSSSPVYNEAFVFHTPLERIKDTDIVVSVMTYGETKSTPKMLGKVVVGPESDNNLGRKHWEVMLTSPRKPVAQWHSLSAII